MLRVLLLFVLWWGVLWLVLPITWLSGELPAVATFLVAPPLSVAGSWYLFKRVRVWRAARAEKTAARKRHAEFEQFQETSLAAQQERLEQARVHVECRGVWVALSQAPGWMYAKARSGWGDFIEEDADEIQGNGREAALVASLERVFAAAFRQSEAVAWLPIRLTEGVMPTDWFRRLKRLVSGPHSFREEETESEPGDDEFPDDWSSDKTLGWVERAWRQAVRSSGIEHPPASPDCQMLPGEGDAATRVIDLFEDETIPAVLVLGMDSPLASTQEENPGDAGHAVLALVFGRTGLDTLEIDDEPVETGPYTPYWERGSAQKGISRWGNLPPSLRSDFLSNCRPITTLHRPASARALPFESRNQADPIRHAIQDAFIHAGFCDPAPLFQQFLYPPQPEPDMEWHGVGWLVHDIPHIKRFTALSSSMIDSDLNPITEASKLRNEFGLVGAAHDALLLAAAIIRAVQLDQPVLLAGTGQDGEMCLGVSKPCRASR